ncbi:MAG: DUF1800 domain-containing protein [Pseudomonadota bacterium]
MNRLRNGTIGTVLTLVLGACGGGSGGSGGPVTPPPPPPPAVTKAEAFQLLNQATFGATEAEAARVMNLGVTAWVDQELAKPASLQLPYLRSLPFPTNGAFELQPDRVDIWFRNAVDGNDQLRQRVAFALSEIMVVSELGALISYPYALADYYDVLAQNAFGNFRDLMQDVTLHPAMGIYLSMLGNEKPDPVLNIRPDENYARELMQLFSIGLVELDIDGGERLDNQGLSIPTYDQAVIEGFAHVFTGWTLAGTANFRNPQPDAFNQTEPMQHYPNFHDTGAKLLLGGVTLPAGQTGEQDLQAALDNVFNHPNVGPFIAIRLIQRLTASNPSPGYVQRVAEVFNDNGAGVRGDLGAVVRALLLDAEARPELPMEIDGKLKEPLLRMTQLFRAYDGRADSGRYVALAPAYIFFGQGPLQSPSVFNFFSPFYAPPGEIRDTSLVAPEFEIATEYQNTFVTNYLFYQTFFFNSLVDRSDPNVTEDTVLIDFEAELALAGDPDALIDSIAGKLLGGEISAALRAEVSSIIANIPADEAALRVADALFLIVTSPEYAYQR